MTQNSTPQTCLLTVGGHTYLSQVKDLREHKRLLKHQLHPHTELQQAYQQHPVIQRRLLSATPEEACKIHPSAPLIHLPSRKTVVRRGWAKNVPASEKAVITPRSNQLDAEAALLESLRSGEDRGLFRSPCGTGKTKMAALFGNHFGKCLFVTHFDELIESTVQSLQETWPGHHIGVIKANENYVAPKWTVASLQTLIRRLDEYPADEWDLIVCDEAHLFGAASGAKVMAHFTPRYYAGLSATPERQTGTPLKHLFGNIVYNLSIQQATKDQLIVPLKGLSVMFNLKTAQINQITQDYDLQSVYRIMGNNKMVQACAEVIRQSHEERPTLIYASTCKHAQKLAAALGKDAEAVKGTDKDRFEKIERFRSGKTRFLVSVDLLSYGFDCPQASCVVLATMIHSPVRFTQIVGRGMRTAKNKTDALLIDLGGNLERGMSLENDWNFHVDRLDPLKIGTGKRSETVDSDDLDWDFSGDFEIEATTEQMGMVNTLLQSLQNKGSKMTGMSTPAQRAALERLGYAIYPSISKKQAHHLINCHPADAKQLQALARRNYDITNIHWTSTAARHVLQSGQN